MLQGGCTANQDPGLILFLEKKAFVILQMFEINTQASFPNKKIVHYVEIKA